MLVFHIKHAMLPSPCATPRRNPAGDPRRHGWSCSVEAGPNMCCHGGRRWKKLTGLGHFEKDWWIPQSHFRSCAPTTMLHYGCISMIMILENCVSETASVSPIYFFLFPRPARLPACETLKWRRSVGFPLLGVHGVQSRCLPQSKKYRSPVIFFHRRLPFSPSCGFEVKVSVFVAIVWWTQL